MRLASQTILAPRRGRVLVWSGEEGWSIRQGCIVAASIVKGQSGAFCGVAVESPGGVPGGQGAKRRLQVRLASQTTRSLAGGLVVGPQVLRPRPITLGT